MSPPPNPGHKAQKTKLPNSIPGYSALVFATILEESLLEIQALDAITSEQRLKKLKLDMPYYRALRFNVAIQHDDVLKGVDPKNLGLIGYKLSKLINDRNFVIMAIRETYVDLKLRRQFTALASLVTGRLQREQDFQDLQEEARNNAAICRENDKSLRLLKRRMKTDVLATDELIANLIKETEDAKVLSAVRVRYLCNWERARRAGQAAAFRDPAADIERYKTKTEQEQIVHMNADYYYTFQIDEILQKMEVLMEKYDSDVEAMDVKIQMQINEYQRAKTRKHYMKKTLASHEVEIAAWKKFVADRESTRLLNEKMLVSALTVQAWWRGILVRQRLGPYRVRKQRRKPVIEKKM